MSHNINHDTNIPTCSTSNIQNIQLLETPVDTETEHSLSSNEEEGEVQVQTQTNTRRQYRKRQTTEWGTEQMHQYRVRKQPQEITQHHDAQRFPIARQNLEVFNKTTVNGHDVGNMDNICSACGAFMFKDEKHVGKLSQSDTITFSACCGNGNY